MIIWRSSHMFLRLSVAIVVACGAPPAVNTAATARPTTGTVTFTTVESSTEPPGATLVELSSYAFKPADIPLAAGKVVFYLVNTSKEAHAMTLRNPAVSILAVVALSADIQAGHSAVFTIENLPAAVYRVSCPIAGHGDMTATMTVR